MAVSLNVENTMWAATVVASSMALGLVIYTGRETRAVMNASQPVSKIGLLDHEINNLSKLLFALAFILSMILVGLRGFTGIWWIYLLRFLIMFSSIIPIRQVFWTL
jgi:phospholipid-translocating ATPase